MAGRLGEGGRGMNGEETERTKGSAQDNLDSVAAEGALRGGNTGLPVGGVAGEHEDATVGAVALGGPPGVVVSDVPHHCLAHCLGGFEDDEDVGLLPSNGDGGLLGGLVVAEGVGDDDAGTGASPSRIRRASCGFPGVPNAPKEGERPDARPGPGSGAGGKAQGGGRSETGAGPSAPCGVGGQRPGSVLGEAKQKEERGDDADAAGEEDQGGGDLGGQGAVS